MAEQHPSIPSKRVRDLTGKIFFYLTVMGFAGTGKRGCTLWRCRCICGKIKVLRNCDLTQGEYKSCGCMRRKRIGDHFRKHGFSKTREYRIWGKMKLRCLCSTAREYPYYGGRGIKVCERWAKSFLDFYLDVGSAPSNRHTLERIANDFDYCPGNVRWATRSEQMRNTRRNRLVTFAGETHCLMDWAIKVGLSYSTLRGRIKTGWTIKDALTIPPIRRRLVANPVAAPHLATRPTEDE